jgi:beta-phosphoglucomutase
VAKYDAILFDFDGVLVDSEPLHFRCWHEILLDFGLRLEWPTYVAKCVGVADRAMLQRLAAEATPPLDVEALYATYPRKKARFRDLMNSEMPFFEDVQPFFHSLREYKLAVVTSSARTEVEPFLEKAGILPYLSASVCAREAARLKPAPDPYLRASQLLGAASPLVVEDSEAGAASGRAAGFDVVQVGGPGQVRELVWRKLIE